MILLKYILVGLVGSVILIFLAKVTMAGLLQRDCSYYNDSYDHEGGEEDA